MLIIDLFITSLMLAKRPDSKSNQVILDCQSLDKPLSKINSSPDSNS